MANFESLEGLTRPLLLDPDGQDKHQCVFNTLLKYRDSYNPASHGCLAPKVMWLTAVNTKLCTVFNAQVN
jgi:hypothetical protein